MRIELPKRQKGRVGVVKNDQGVRNRHTITAGAKVPKIAAEVRERGLHVWAFRLDLSICE